MSMNWLTNVYGPLWRSRNFGPNRQRKIGVWINIIFSQVVAKLLHSLFVWEIGYKVRSKRVVEFRRW